MKTYCVDFDDFCDVTVPELDVLKAVKEKYEGFKVTLFTIPQRTSDASIKHAKELGDWVQLAPHGWRHTRGECLAWSTEEAVEKIREAANRGINAPVFRAPGWLLDGDVYEACQQLGYTVAAHEVYRIPNSGVAEYIYNAKDGRKNLVTTHGHMTDCGHGYIKDLHAEGKLEFKPGIFKFPQELSYMRRGTMSQKGVVCAP